jgi:hypothetical protein
MEGSQASPFCPSGNNNVHIKKSVEHWWNGLDWDNRRDTKQKACTSATLFTTNPTWTGTGSKPCPRCERPATNHLSHGTALKTKINLINLLRTKLDLSWRSKNTLTKCALFFLESKNTIPKDALTWHLTFMHMVRIVTTATYTETAWRCLLIHALFLLSVAGYSRNQRLTTNSHFISAVETFSCHLTR